MRTFKSVGKHICPICSTSKEGEAILIPINGTEDGNNMEAQPIHVDCLNLSLNKDLGLIYQKIG